MHPENALHTRGMWLAFALTAVVIAALVSRLLQTIERRDRALEALRRRSEGAMRAASLATLATGAAHELSTPLATIAVAARELERALETGPGAALQDARLIRDEVDRCRTILDDLAGQSGTPPGEAPKPASVGHVIEAVLARLPTGDRARMTIAGDSTTTVNWPIRPMTRAIANLVQNAMQAASTGTVCLSIARANERVRIAVIDSGPGMSDDVLSRAGEPFFTTRAGGTGLGLFVTRTTVEQLGGRFDLTCPSGGGCIATIDMPTGPATPADDHA
jgi:two-component system sensor histidine kinase RegB